MSTASATGHELHRGIAEQGKVHALAGRHDDALAHYREAMRLSVERDAPEAFFRHYLECSIESLEALGAYADVVEYCERVAGHYAGLEPATDLQAAFVELDTATNAQRLGANLLKLGRTDDARTALADAIAIAERHHRQLPLATTLLGWVDRRLTVEPARIESEQRRLGYYAVTPETVDPTIAIPLPAPSARPAHDTR